MNRKNLIGVGTIIIIIGAIVAIAILGTSVSPVSPKYGTANPEAPIYGLNMQTYSVTYDADTQYVGRCHIVTPPTSDYCEAAEGTIRYPFFAQLVNASNFKSWKKSSPGDYARLTAHMNAPRCPTPVGNVQDMKTPLGAAFYNVVEAYACAASANGGTIEPLTWPAPATTLDPNRTDKTPPTAPGPLTVAP